VLARAQWGNMARRGRAIQVHAIELCSRHDRGKPTVRRGEIRSHEIVVVQLVVAREIAHSAVAEHIKEHSRGVLRIAGSGHDKSVHSGSVGIGRTPTVAITMALGPGGAGILRTGGLQVVGINRGPSRIHVRSSRGLAVKSSAIGGLREAVRLPVVRQVAEVVIERAVFLRNDDDMVDRGDIVRDLSKGCGHACALPIGKRNLAICAATRATETGKTGSRSRGRGQGDGGAITETGVASGWTIDSSRAAGDRARAGNCNRQLCGISAGERRRNGLVAGKGELA
jgi:hypothetical protein